MRLPQSNVVRGSVLVTLMLIAVPAFAMVYFQTLEQPSGLASAAELRVPQPSVRPAGLGAGIQLTSFTQPGPQDGPGISVNPCPAPENLPSEKKKRTAVRQAQRERCVG
jgi:hypothetical protein